MGKWDSQIQGFEIMATFVSCNKAGAAQQYAESEPL